MIIACPCGEKKFEIDSNLIPDKGRLLKCGSCDHTWFFNKHDEINNNKKINLETLEKKIKETIPKVSKKIDKIKTKKQSNLPDNKGSELITYKPKLDFTFGKFLNYLIVLIISFAALIIFSDTFKDPLSILFPDIELILYSFFETLKDLILFFKDLF
tara:strand:- start:186 stop:656 length:471 start_codon:yes stop_codon:yes gene_type:complete